MGKKSQSKITKSRSRLQQKLKQIYHNIGEEGAYTNNIGQLLRIVREQGFPNASREDIKHFLTTDPSYTVHKRIRSLSFPRRHIRVPARGVRLDGDLIELGDLQSWNDGNHYILIIIDTFTKYVWAKPLKKKESKQVADAFLAMTPPPSSIFLYTDAGKEFTGAPFQQALRQRKMRHRICSSDDFHCPFVERVIRTVKERLFQAMTSRRTRRWVNLLLPVIATYNNTQHSTIKMKPSQAQAGDGKTMEIYRNTLARYPIAQGRRPPKYKFQKGDLVRIYKSQDNLRSKGYLPRFTWEIFRIRERANTRPLDRRAAPAYILEDLHGEVIEHAVFYEDELSKVDPSQLTHPQPVREIIDQKKDGKGIEWVKVWWQGGQKKDAEWIQRRQLV